jgi:hypothetical protein
MQIIPSPDAGQILMVITPYVGGQLVFELVARLALQGELMVLDGGNTFNAYHVVRTLRRQTQAYDQAMARICLSRVFTCYQMATLLAELGEKPRGDAPLLALDFLSSFADQNVPVAERRRLLKTCLGQLRRMTSGGPVGVWVRARTVAPEEMEEFTGLVARAAGRVWRMDHLPPVGPLQLGLFPQE